MSCGSSGLGPHRHIAVDELVEEVIEVLLFRSGQVAQELVFGGHEVVDGAVGGGVPGRREPNEGAAAVVGVGTSLDEPGSCEAIESVGHPRGGDHRDPSEGRWGQDGPVATAAQRGEDVEFADGDAVRREQRLGRPQRGVDEQVEAKGGAHGIELKVGALLSPAGHRVVEEFAHRHDHIVLQDETI